MSAYRSYSRTSGKLSPAALALLAFLAGCGSGGIEGTGSGNGGNGGGPPDTTAPSVTSMTPGQDSSGVGINSKLTATLSEAMAAALITEINPATGNPANFRLATGPSYLSGAVIYDAANHIAVFTPAVALLPNTGYTATIITGVKDLAGNPVTFDFAWDFTTGGTADSSAPGVTSTLPVDAATGVAVNRKITATFSEDMDPSTITPASFTVTGPGPVSGTVTYLRRTAIFTPAGSLAPNTTYTAAITTGVKDLAGNASQANAAWSFTTGDSADLAAPVAAPTHPASAASGVAVGSTISVGFNEPMDPATLTTANFLVTGPGTTPVIGIVVYGSDNTATFTRHNHLTTPVIDPVIDLERGTTYTATLTTGARDMAGNALAGNLVWSFTTAP